MAVYKVIQDIEAEDKLLGPLTLKGFIYIAIAGVLAFINVRLLIAGGPIYIRLAIIFVLLFPMLLFGVLASPLGRDQPTEVWLLSHIRFLLKPRDRNWDQAGVDQLVTVTAPKRLEQHLTKGFSQNEVQSRLQALATTLDSRGWAIKNSAINLSTQNDYQYDGTESDRLIAPSALAEPAQVIDVHPADDIMDEQNNATAQHFNELMKAADNQRKQAITDKLSEARSAITSDTRFLDDNSQDGNTIFVGRTTIAPQDQTADQTTDSNEPLPPEAVALLEREHKRDEEIHRRSASFHPKASGGETTAQKTKEEISLQNTVTANQAAAKLELAQSGNVLSVASVAHLANRLGQPRQIGPDEVEISLH